MVCQLTELIVEHAGSVDAHKCVQINLSDGNNAFFKLQHRFYDVNHGILRGYRHKNISKTAEFMRKFWAEVVSYFEKELSPSQRKAALQQDGWLAKAYKQAKMHSNARSTNKSQQAKSKAAREEKKLELEATESGVLHVGKPQGAMELQKQSKKAFHSTGLTRSGPRDAASVNLQALDTADKDPLGNPPKDFDEEMMKSFQDLQKGTQEFMKELQQTQKDMNDIRDQAKITNLMRLRDDPQTPPDMKACFQRRILEIMKTMVGNE